MSMKNPLTPAGIEPATFGFVAQHLNHCGTAVPTQQLVPGIFPEGYRRPVHRADNLTAFMCRLSWNLRASNCWNLQSLSRPAIGLLYLYLYTLYRKQILKELFFSLEHSFQSDVSNFTTLKSFCTWKKNITVELFIDWEVGEGNRMWLDCLTHLIQ